MALLAIVLLFTPAARAAQLTLQDGVVVKFGADAQLVVRDRLVPGKGLAFTSAKDDSVGGQTGPTPQTPTMGDWRGLRLEKSAAAFGALTLEDVSLRYGGGQGEAALTVRGFSPALRFLYIADNLLGLRTLGGAAPAVTGSSLLRNFTGLEALDTSAPAVSGSQFAGTMLLAVSNLTGSAIQAPGNWWGHATGPKDSIANPAGLGDEVSPLGVNFDAFLGLPPLLNPTLRLAAPEPYFDQHSLLLEFGCVNATEYRIAEGNDFGTVPFQPLVNGWGQALFTTSNGDGRKTLNVQFRGANGILDSATLAGGVLIDTQDPALTLTNPTTGSLIRQAITIEAQASDEAGLAQVQIFVEGQLLATRVAPPYTYLWDTGPLTDGAYTIKAVATDIAGRSSEQSAVVTLSHAPPPPDTDGPQMSNISANGAALTDGASFASDIAVSFTAGDRSGVARIDLLLDGVQAATASGSGSYAASVNLNAVANGSHAFALRAIDSLGNVSTANYTINVAHVPPPAPVLSQPANGLVTRTANVPVSGTAKLGSSVQVWVDGQMAGAAVTVGSDGRFYTTAPLNSGSNAIQATATDYYGTGPASNEVLVTLDQSVPASPGSLTATAGAAGKVRLAWTRSSDANAVGYDLYRASATFDSITQASKLNTSPLTAALYDDLPPHDGTWTYRVVAVNRLGTPSDPSNAAQAVSDATPPRAQSIVYSPAKFDAAKGRIGQGKVDVAVTASEALPSTPYLSIIPQGGAPIAVALAQTGATAYTGSFLIDANTPSGIANALFSARDAAGNRGTEIDLGATLMVDTAGPALSGIALNPASPIKNDAGQTVEATLTFSEAPQSVPQVNVLLSGSGREPIALGGIASIDPTTWRGSFTLPADAGHGSPETLSFSFQANDDMGNVSTKVLATNLFQVYQGALPPLAVPNAFTAQAQPGGKVKLGWQAVEGASRYQVYRQAPGQTMLQPLASASSTDYLDQTSADGSYVYAVVSVRVANDQEAVSGQSQPVTVAASATAPGAPQSLALSLSGQGVAAQWQAPATGVVAGYNLYRATGTQITGIAGLTPFKTGIKQTFAVDPSPSPTQAAYAVTALDAAGNESAPSNSAYLNASLLPVSQLTIERSGTALPVLSWTPPNGTLAGYQVYADVGGGADKHPLTLNPIMDLNFTDTGYTGGDRLYTVATVDANGVQMPRSLLLPSVGAQIVAGLPLQRGIMNQLQVRVANASASRLDNVRVFVRLPTDPNATQFKDHSSALFSLEAGQTLTVPVVVGGYAGLPSLAQAQLRVEIAPHEGEWVRIAQDQALEVTDGTLVVGMSTAGFTRGGSGQVKLTIENTSDVEIELLTASGNGSAASPELRFKILDADGNVLAIQPFKQVLGANVVTLANGQTVARIPAGASYASDVFSLNVPASSPNTIRVKLEVDQLRYHTGKDDALAITGRGSEKSVSLIDTAYFGEVTGVSPVNSFGDQAIAITGRALDRANNAPLPNTPLKLVLNQQGFERVFSVLTDGTGSFTYTFTPGSSDAGLYKASAVHPDTTDRPEQKSFTIERVTVSPTPYRLDIPRNHPFTIPFAAKAGPGAAATNLRFALNAASQPTGQLPAGINAQLPAPVALAEKQTQNLPVVFTVGDAAQSSGSVILDLLSDEHSGSALSQVRVDYALFEAKPYLTSTPSFVETGLAQGGNQIESVTVQNQGLQDALNLKFTLTQPDGSPAPNWASIASQADGTLAVGAQRAIDLAFAPPSEIAEGVYEFRLRVVGDNLPSQTLNVYVSLTQSGQGDVLFKASDIYTATVGKDGLLIPGLAGASVTLQNEDVITVTREGTTDSGGEALFQGLPTGSYQFRVKAANHQEVGGRLQIKPGITANQRVFLDYNLVTVEWSVREITIQDRYDIILNTTFETDVPAAVMVLEPAIVNLPKMNAGEVFYGELSLVNYGLIAAENVVQQLPQADAYFRYEFLADVPSRLEAKQRITLPYRVVALQSLEVAASGGNASGGGCYSHAKAVCYPHDYTCANGHVTHLTVCTTLYSGSNSSCPSGGGGGVGGGGGIGGIGGSGGAGGFGGAAAASTPLLAKPNSKCIFCPKEQCPEKRKDPNQN